MEGVCTKRQQVVGDEDEHEHKHDATPKKKPRPDEMQAQPEKGGGNDDDMLAWLTLDDAEMEELMSLLLEPSPPATSPTSSSATSTSSVSALGFKVSFIDDPFAASPSIVRSSSSSSFVTINGNEETCGSSFSDSHSSLMVSFDTRGLTSNLNTSFARGGAGAWASDLEEARGGCGELHCDGDVFAAEDDLDPSCAVLEWGWEMK